MEFFVCALECRSTYFQFSFVLQSKDGQSEASRTTCNSSLFILTSDSTQQLIIRPESGVSEQKPDSVMTVYDWNL